MSDTVTVGQTSPFGQTNYCLQICQTLVDARNGSAPLSSASSGGVPATQAVGYFGPFGASREEILKQICQILLDARNGTAPLIFKSV